MKGISTQSIAALLIDVAVTQVEDTTAALGQIKEALGLAQQATDQARVGLDQALEAKLRAASNKAKLKVSIKETRARRLVEASLSQMQDALKNADNLAMASGRQADRFAQVATNMAGAADAATSEVPGTIVAPADVTQAMTAQAGADCQAVKLATLSRHTEQGRRKTVMQNQQSALSRQLKAMEKFGLFGKIIKIANVVLMPLAVASGGVLAAPLAASAAATGTGILAGLGISGNAMLASLVASLPSTLLGTVEQFLLMEPAAKKQQQAAEEAQSARQGLTGVAQAQETQAWREAQIQKASARTLQNLEQSTHQ